VIDYLPIKKNHKNVRKIAKNNTIEKQVPMEEKGI